jgi:TRAP-type C4-dicarboxylate transport system permease small subunit
MENIDRVLIRAEQMIAGGALLFITILTAIAVILRSVAGVTFSWVEEMTQYIMLYVAFFGSVLAVSINGHVGIDILFKFIPERFHKHFNVFLNLFSLIFLIWLTYTAGKYTLTIHLGGQRSATLSWMPRSVLYFSCVIGSLLMVVEYGKAILRLLRDIRRGKGENAVEKPERL